MNHHNLEIKLIIDKVCSRINEAVVVQVAISRTFCYTRKLLAQRIIEIYCNALV